MSQDEEPMTKAERVRARMRKSGSPARAASRRSRAVPVNTPSVAPLKPAAQVEPKVNSPVREDRPTPTVSVSIQRSKVPECAEALESLEVFETKRERVVRTEEGEYLEVPESWAHLAPGDAAITRRVKAAGPCWTVKEKRGRKMFSRGIWSDAEVIAREVEARALEVTTPAYKRKLAKSRDRAAQKQEVYVEDFTEAVRDFLDFSPEFKQLESQLAEVVSAHATPVGSGTVARTERIPIERRAEAAVIAWMRHQTTAYDTMQIARVKGKRREVRRLLAERSRQLLERYRGKRGASAQDDEQVCPLRQALE